MQIEKVALINLVHVARVDGAVSSEETAMILRYGTLITGSAAGRRLLLVAYPSMDAIEKSYNSLRADPKYAAFIAKAEIDFRNIIRITA